jgi:hypothetical protein
MSTTVILLSVPGLRAQDLPRLPALASALPFTAQLTASFPCVTWPVQANLLTGCLPREHGVVANGFYWRDTHEVEMWTAGNEQIAVGQIWDHLKARHPRCRSAAWFPMLSKRCGADYVCMPAPVHNPDGSESLWCYTKPESYYGTLRDALGDFPLHHFWGPAAGIPATQWICASAVQAAREYRPEFFYIYLPHLDYAAQRSGPDSAEAYAALGELDAVIGQLIAALHDAYGPQNVLCLAACEYVITEVQHVSYPNRVLRDAGLLHVRRAQQQELLDLERSRAWALADHQFSHVFVQDADPHVLRDVLQCLMQTPGIDEVLCGQQRGKYALDHPRAGEVIAISHASSWQAYYWWTDDALAPAFARQVDIHRKPGYDPMELFWDRTTHSVPLDATRVRGSHGAPVTDDVHRGVILSSQADILPGGGMRDVDVAPLILRQFDIKTG